MTLTPADADKILADHFAPWVLALGLTVEETGERHAVLRLPWSDSLARDGGGLSGQALMAAADTATVIAVSAARGAYGPMTTVQQADGVPAPASLWRNRDFTVFWLGQALSVLGGSLSLVALPMLVLAATGSLVQMGLITVVTGVSGILTGLFAGHVADRCDRRRLMVACDLLRAVLLGAVPLLWLTAGPLMWPLYVLTALVTALKTVFDVAYVSAVPQLVGAGELTAANSRLMGTFALGTLAGPVVAGFITAGAGGEWALGIDGATFLVSAVSLRWVTFGRHAPPAGETAARAAAAPAGGLREVFTVGFRFLWGHVLLRPLTVLLTLLTFVTMGATDLLVYRVREDLGRDAATLGYVIALSGLGVVAAALAAGRLRRVLGFGPCWLGTVGLIAVSVAGIGLSRSVPVIAVLAAVFMFGMTLGGITSMTLRQEVTPDELLGRVTSAFWTVHNAAGPVGAAVLTGLGARYGVPAVSVAGGVLCLLILGAGLATPLRGARRGPAPRGQAADARIPGGRRGRRAGKTAPGA
ncbi:MFS transporter [Streptomyces katrae]|uniref:MFS transporter n=1 Tax=Streptomyces katrae TaxID=68223 RepID=UPI001331A724|nr:MFS transporter [Streptomyces katrae]